MRMQFGASSFNLQVTSICRALVGTRQMAGQSIRTFRQFMGILGPSLIGRFAILHFPAFGYVMSRVV